MRRRAFSSLFCSDREGRRPRTEGSSPGTLLSSPLCKIESDMAHEDPSKIPIDQPRYGTFSPVSHQHLSLPNQPSAPFPPPGMSTTSTSSQFYQNPQEHNYHAIPVGYQAYGTVVEGIPVREAWIRPIRERRLPCCGLGIGWALFLAGFFFASVPWYVGACILLFVGVDYREKAGLLACTIGAIIIAITVIFGVSKENLDFDW